MTNIQSSNPTKLPVKTELVKQLLVRVMTRNEPDNAKRMLDRQTLMKNLETLNHSPEAHLGFVMEVMNNQAVKKQPPVFETGLMFGVALTLSARNANGILMLKKMLKDIEIQQEGSESSDATAEDVTEEVPQEIVTPEQNESQCPA